MKKIAKLLFASAALLTAFVSCQKVEEISEAPKTTHIVRFTTEMPTKTSYTVEGTTVNYKWEESDLYRLHVYEDGVEGTIIVDESAIDETYVMLTVSFEGKDGNSHTYTANLNGGVVKSEQVADGKYDSDCDVLVAKPVSSEEITDGIYTFQFRRPVAITELKLKGLKADEKVSKVTIISDSEHPIAGKYTQSSTDYSTGDWSDTSNKIVVTFGTEQDGTTPKTKTIGSDGVLPMSIVTRPIKEASVKVLVETENGLKYRKVTASALTLLADVVKAQGIGMTPVTEAEHAEDGWYLVTDANELFDGDEIRIACTSKNMMSGDLAIKDDKTQTYLANYEVSFQDGKLTGVTPGSEPQIFTLYEGYDKWNITTANGKLGATAVKTLKYDDGTLDWGIGIGNEGVATISSSTDGYGAIKYNASSPRFLNYASGQTDIQIFKKYGDAVDPVIKTARTASFSPESATVTIDANDNDFPTLSFEPAEATEGTQNWTSSNEDVATVDATSGEVTLVSDGTTTISVEIGESETYQPCSAEYVLTVNPAAEEGVDLLNLEWTGVEAKATYADWSNKVGDKSGNTYAGNSAGDKNSIQLRTNNSNSGIVVTSSASNQVAKKITVDWNTNTSSGRTLDIYGKSTAYSTASDLYDGSKQGTKLGSIVKGTSTELTIEGDYEFIGIRSNSSALYLNWIKIQWEDPKPKYEACFKDADGNEVTEINATVGSVFTAPTLYKGATQCFADNYESSDTDVATVDELSGTVTLKKKGDAIITATLNGDATHRTTKASYTIHVSNELSSIKLAEDSEQPTTFYVGQDFSFAGIKLEAEYNDGEQKTLTADDLTADNFSGFDSSAAVGSQTITVSFTDGATETTTYNVEIKPLVTLYGITVPAEDANGNSITVKGGLTEAPEGGEIELNVNLNTDKGYKLTSLKVNEAEHSSDVAGGKYTFTMPAEAVTVTAEFDNHYTVTLTPPAANGTVKVQNATTSSQSIACGETVSVLAEPATGYELDSWTINGAELADATKASTTFTMPANDVTITASFKKHVEAQKITLTAANVTDFDSSYKEYAWSVNGVAGNMWAYRGGSSGSYNMQFNKTTYVKNTSAVPGRIKSITMTKASGTNRTWSVYVGATALTSTTGATQVESAKEVSSETKWTVTSGDYYYFYLTKADGGTNIGSIVIEYEPSGDVPSTTMLSTPTDLTWTEGTKTLSWTNTNTSNGTYGTNYKYQYRIGSDGSWTDATSATTAVLTITETKTVYVKAVAVNTTNYSDSDETTGTSCTISSSPSGELTNGKSYSYTIESKVFDGNNQSKTLGGMDWKFTTDNAGYYSYDSGVGLHLGSGSKTISYAQFELDYDKYCDSGTAKKVNTVKVTCRSAGTSPTVSVTVGGEAVESAKTINNTMAEYTFTASKSLSGSIVINISQTSGTKAIYIQKVSIN